MYTEEKYAKRSLLKEFILKLILIIIFVLLLVWLVPWPNMNALNPLKDQIFNANLQTMKEAGISYFTTERLPQNVGDKTTLTLQKMLDMKLVVPFTDKNGNSCDVKKSYVSLEKQETEYLMKVNLKCGEEEDYIIVHLGCYSYCTSAICEAKPDTKPVTKTYKCKIVDNRYWGKDAKIVDKVTYEKECTTVPTPVPKTYQCKIVDNKYWGKNKKIVDKATYEKECKSTPTPPPVVVTYTCKIVDGKYWGKDAKVVDKATYENQCIEKPKYQCALVNNEYWGKNYTVVDKATYEKECTQPVVEKEYQYLKTTTEYEKFDAVYSNWSNWTVYTLKKGETIPKSTSLMEVVDLGTKRIAIGVKDAVYEKVTQEYYKMLETNMTLTYNLCKNYSYVADATTVYRVIKDWEYTDEYMQGYRENIPNDTIDTIWELQSVDFDQCGNTCTSHPYARYRKKVRKIVPETNISNITATCTDVETKTIKIQIPGRVVEASYVLKTPEQTLYGDIHQYKVRKRTLISEAVTKEKISTEEKWSFYNDTTLINSGFVMTGQSRDKVQK